MVKMKDRAVLTNEKIAEWTDKAEQVYEEALKGKAKAAPSVRLGIEEMLLRFMECYGTEEECSFECHKGRRMLRFVIAQKGAQCNPIELGDDELTYNLLERLDLKPRYTYRARQGKNTVSVPVHLPLGKNAMLIHLAIALVLALLTKLLVSWLPAEIGTEYIQPLLSELFKKITQMFSAVATPLVLCAVIGGISGLGDVVSFGKIGGRLLRRMMFTYCIATVFMVGIGTLMGMVTTQDSAGGKNVFQDLLALVLDMIPGNLVEPFRTDNALQVIVLAIFIGVVMLGLGEKVALVRNFITEAGDLVNRMMLVICRLLPLFVYLGISDLLLSDRLENVSRVTQILLMILAGTGLVILITCLRTKAVTKLPLRKVFSAQLPSLMINLTTSSQVSALPESIRCCKEKLGIDPKIVDFGLPLGIVIYMPNGTIILGSMAWGLSVMTNGPLDVSTVIKIAFVAVIVAIAAPPIPGSAFAVMPILFSACGTDLSMMPLAVIVASTVGYLAPAMNGFCLQLELLMTAWKNGMVDKEALLRTEDADRAAAG